MPETKNSPCSAPRRRALRAAAIAVASLGPMARAVRAVSRDAGLRILCSGPAGSIPDLIARVVAEQWAATTGQQVVVDNRAGAAGQLSVVALKNGPVDGSSLLLAQGAVATVYPALYARLGYDAARDLQPVSLAAEMAIGLALGPAVPAHIGTLDAFLDWARRNPQALNVGSPGTGTVPHLVEAVLFAQAGIPWQHIAYAGGPPAVTQLLGGQIAALALPEGLLWQHQAAGRVRIVATSGPTRSIYLPEVPTFAEQGRGDLVVQEWFAFFASGGVAKDLVAARSVSLQDAIARPPVATAFAQAGMVPASSTPAVLAARIAREQRAWQPVLHAHGIRAE